MSSAQVENAVCCLPRPFPPFPPCSDLLVLDEVMQHLDEEGCARVAGVLKTLPYSSVLVVAQAHSFLTQARRDAGHGPRAVAAAGGVLAMHGGAVAVVAWRSSCTADRGRWASGQAAAP